MGSSTSFFTFMYLSFLLSFCQLTSSRQPLCHDNERNALLRFKESFVIKKFASLYPSAYPKAARWNLEENSDCCSWEGVKCNEDTGYVIKLDLTSSYLYGSLNSASNTLFNLVHLQWLSLADNHFNFSKIPYGIKNLSKLSHLNLSYSVFSGQIPPEMLELSNLESLDLSENDELQLHQPGLKSLMEKLTNLKVLDLGLVNISSSLSQALTNLSSLKFLSLQNCNLQGKISSSLGNLTSLNYLDLSYNHFEDELPTFMGNLASLEVLKIKHCNFSIQALSCLSNLSQLNYLDLSYNNILTPSSLLSCLGEHSKLVGLELSGINYIGKIPFWLKNLTQLTHLYMDQNQLTGSIPFWLMKLNNLEVLDLSSNNLSGTMVLEMLIHKLKNLTTLDLSSNRLSLLTKSIVNTSLQNFESLRLRSCNLIGFPNFIRYQYQLYELDLSSNNISGRIPGWLFNLSIGSFRSLNLSHNLLTEFDQQSVVLSRMHLNYLDLSFNKLQGSLPIPSISSVRIYVVSNNRLSGKVPLQICKWNSLYGLDLSNNNLSGKLPQCLGNFSQSLLMLNLQNNTFHGSIPQTFMNGTSLRMIDLSNNKLGGKLPRSLANCTMLEFLDLGNNRISDTFPSWIGTLPKLVVLNLRWNKFHGIIEDHQSKFEFPKLQIIDLSNNRFNGKLPSIYFECWNSMKVVNASQLVYMMKEADGFDFYDYSLTLVNKGIEREYVKISTMLVSICLSNNRFEGMIPASISDLKGLRYLDLSNNNLVGGIPPALGNLTELESLDLSNNSLSGEIPQSLVKLTPLAFFNVPYNNLTGRIPQGAQFDTFSNMSYKGNPGLCGQPLSKKCENLELPPNEDDQGSESSLAFGWKVVAVGYAIGLIIGMVLGHIFCTRKYELFLKIFRMPLQRMEGKRGLRRD